MSSVGQAVGMVVGGVIGFFAGGNVMLGAAIGGAIGGAIDPPPGPKVEGPRLDDLSLQTSTYGAPKTRAYGTVAVMGNVFWLENNAYTEHKKEEDQGGKGGGGGATYTTYTYSATFAVSLCEGQQIGGIRRLWIGDNLVYDVSSNNAESLVGSLNGGWALYLGTDDQSPDPRIQADVGAANCPSWPGRSYIVFYDLDLTEKYSNTLLRAQVKAEISVADPSAVSVQMISEFSSKNLFPPHRGNPLNCGTLNELDCEYSITYNVNSGTPIVSGLEFGNAEYFVNSGTTSSYTMPVIGSTRYTSYAIEQSDRNVAIVMTETPDGSREQSLWIISGGGATTYLPVNRIFGYDSNNDNIKRVAIEGSVFWFIPDSGAGTVFNIVRLSGSTLTATATLNCDISSVGYSESFLFVVKATAANPVTIYKLDKFSLSLLDTFTYNDTAHNGPYIISVESDSLFYLWSMQGDLFRWENGVMVSRMDDVMPTQAMMYDGVIPSVRYRFKVFSYTPLKVLSFSSTGRPYYPETSIGRVFLSSSYLTGTSAKLRDIVTSECALCSLDASDLDLTELTNSDVRGYRVSGVKSPRGALETLQAAWPFDVFMKGYKVGFKSRGGASAATISEIDLGATADADKTSVLLPVSREMETQIALNVTVKYLDSLRNYEISEQTSPERPGVSSVEPRTVDLPIVLTADEAVQVADVLNSKEWTERIRFGPFSLPPTYAALQPADVVTINHRNRAWEARLTRVEYLSDGRLNCEAVLTSSSAYTSTAQGADQMVLGQALVTLKGSSRAVVLDIPRLDSAQDSVGVASVMYGFTAAWPGGVLARSDDQGVTWKTLTGFDSKGKVFTITEVPAANSGYSFDHATVLTATPAWTGATLFSVTEDEIYNGANIAAYGVAGRWEIVSFRTVIDNTGTYTLKDFLRGQYGTEWATGLHAANDLLVMLDTTTVQFIGLPTTAIGTTQLWRAVTQGSYVSSGFETSVAYTAENLEPLEMVDVVGSRYANNWTISGERRTRWPVSLFSGVVVPTGETSESYQFEIWTSGFATKVRTITSATTSVQYTSAEQTTDFGSNQTTLYVRARMVSSVVGAGRSYNFVLT